MNHQTRCTLAVACIRDSFSIPGCDVRQMSTRTAHRVQSWMAGR